MKLDAVKELYSTEVYLKTLLMTNDPLEEAEMIRRIEAIFNWARESDCLTNDEVKVFFRPWVEKIEIAKAHSAVAQKIRSLFALNLT